MTDSWTDIRELKLSGFVASVVVHLFVSVRKPADNAVELQVGYQDRQGYPRAIGPDAPTRCQWAGMRRGIFRLRTRTARVVNMPMQIAYWL